VSKYLYAFTKVLFVMKFFIEQFEIDFDPYLSYKHERHAFIRLIRILILCGLFWGAF